MPDVHIAQPKPIAQEGSSISITAYFRASGAGSAPTTAQYRVDCLTTGTELTDWTDLTPAESNAITITATENAIQNSSNFYETKQLTVQADQGETTQTRDRVTWRVENNQCIPRT